MNEKEAHYFALESFEDQTWRSQKSKKTSGVESTFWVSGMYK